jgi:hypothetical protein
MYFSLSRLGGDRYVWRIAFAARKVFQDEEAFGPVLLGWKASSKTDGGKLAAGC